MIGLTATTPSVSTSITIPGRMNFGALRVLNDDRVAPGKGFGTHPHKNMEIISIPLKGKLKHGDSHQNSRVITPGDIQTMSAGTGIYHSEMNGSDTEAVEFLQIWVMPEKLNTPPAYQTSTYVTSAQK